MGRIFKQGIDLKNVVITGGEPLIQFNELYPLVYELLNDDYKVAIETGNCYKLPRDTYRRSFRYLVDCKTPSSGVAKKNVFTNLLYGSTHTHAVELSTFPYHALPRRLVHSPYRTWAFFVNLIC